MLDSALPTEGNVCSKCLQLALSTSAICEVTDVIRRDAEELMWAHPAGSHVQHQELAEDTRHPGRRTIIMDVKGKVVLKNTGLFCLGF
jgi:hypothetical protein